jgi:hypothetical protein
VQAQHYGGAAHVRGGRDHCLWSGIVKPAAGSEVRLDGAGGVRERGRGPGARGDGVDSFGEGLIWRLRGALLGASGLLKAKSRTMRAVAIAATHVVSVEENARRIIVLAAFAFLALC